MVLAAYVELACSSQTGLQSNTQNQLFTRECVLAQPASESPECMLTAIATKRSCGVRAERTCAAAQQGRQGA